MCFILFIFIFYYILNIWLIFFSFCWWLLISHRSDLCDLWLLWIRSVWMEDKETHAKPQKAVSRQCCVCNQRRAALKRPKTLDQVILNLPPLLPNHSPVSACLAVEKNWGNPRGSFVIFTYTLVGLWWSEFFWIACTV